MMGRQIPLLLSHWTQPRLSPPSPSLQASCSSSGDSSTTPGSAGWPTPCPLCLEPESSSSTEPPLQSRWPNTREIKKRSARRTIASPLPVYDGQKCVSKRFLSFFANEQSVCGMWRWMPYLQVIPPSFGVSADMRCSPIRPPGGSRVRVIICPAVVLAHSCLVVLC